MPAWSDHWILTQSLLYILSKIAKGGRNMKAIAINGSPRHGWNTELLLKEALRGAVDTGAEVELIQLYDLAFTGCRSCFACKRKGAELCRCYLRDDLSPVLDRVLQADAIFLGSPIYFSDVSAQTHCFLERLRFILMTYDDYQKQLFEGHINAGVFFTMNASLEQYKAGLEGSLDGKVSTLRRLGGRVKVYPCCDTLQFSNYSAYHAATFDEAHKQAVHADQFPKDLQAAYDMGLRLTEGH